MFTFKIIEIVIIYGLSYVELNVATKNKEKDVVTFDDINDIVTGKVKFKRIWEFSTKDVWFKDRRSGVPTRGLSSRQISKLYNLSRVEAESQN